MSEFIPLSVPNLKGNELKYVTHAIETEWVSTGGSYINDFEKTIATYVKASGAVACQSGTAGLHLALMLSGVGREDEVLVPTLTFIAAVNPISYVGASPIFMDCGKDFCIDVDKVEQFCATECKMTKQGLMNRKTEKLIKAIVVVHVFGNMVQMESIMNLAKKYQLKVIEDATEALGSCYTEGAYAGKFAGTIGDFGVYSFNGNKIITTGGGGMFLAKSEKDLRKAKYLSTQAKDDELNFIHDEIGYNYRMTNVQAAIGLAQLEVIEDFIEIKKKHFDLYKELLESVEGVRLLDFTEGIRPNYWFYPLIIDEEKTGYSVSQWIEALGKEKIQARPVWELIHKQKPYQNQICYKIEQAEIYRKSIINIPCSTNLTKEQVEKVVRVIKTIAQQGR